MDRRSWMQQVLAVLSMAVGAEASAAGQEPTLSPPPAATADQLAAALKLLGLSFPDEEMRMMLPGVNRALASYEGLRKVEIPLDTEPAFAFHAGLPGRSAVTR